MHVTLSLDGYQHLWHTREEIEAATQAEEAAEELARRLRVRYQAEAFGLAEVVRMLDGDCTIYGPEQEHGAAGVEQLAQEGDEADV